jgi:hypothetical protein
LLAQFASHWRDHLLALDAAATRHRWRERGLLHELSYEQLCDDPRRELAALADFMAIDARPLLDGDLGAIRNQNAKSRSMVHGALLERVNQIAAPALAAKGYGESP